MEPTVGRPAAEERPSSKSPRRPGVRALRRASAGAGLALAVLLPGLATAQRGPLRVEVAPCPEASFDAAALRERLALELGAHDAPLHVRVEPRCGTEEVQVTVTRGDAARRRRVDLTGAEGTGRVWALAHLVTDLVAHLDDPAPDGRAPDERAPDERAAAQTRDREGRAEAARTDREPVRGATIPGRDDREPATDGPGRGRRGDDREPTRRGPSGPPRDDERGSATATPPGDRQPQPRVVANAARGGAAHGRAPEASGARAAGRLDASITERRPNDGRGPGRASDTSGLDAAASGPADERHADDPWARPTRIAIGATTRLYVDPPTFVPMAAVGVEHAWLRVTLSGGGTEIPGNALGSIALGLWALELAIQPLEHRDGPLRVALSLAADVGLLYAAGQRRLASASSHEAVAGVVGASVGARLSWALDPDVALELAPTVGWDFLGSELRAGAERVASLHALRVGLALCVLLLR
ncbi:MAG TPA: hypothetical protein RMH99_18795 [Sandaracinaceae bacterium LLY-WYZ-13_1]|nr:hypothetical protein [Sandaracinaceae bacterium LLY-WYZ-13_1]